MPCKPSDNDNGWSITVGKNAIVNPENGDVILRPRFISKDFYNTMVNSTWDKYDKVIDPIIRIRDQAVIYRLDKAYMDRVNDILNRMNENTAKGIGFKNDPVLMNMFKVEYKPKFNSLYVNCCGNVTCSALDVVFGNTLINGCNDCGGRFDYVRSEMNVSCSNAYNYLYYDMFGFGILGVKCPCGSGCSASCGGNAGVSGIVLFVLNALNVIRSPGVVTNNGSVGTLISSSPIEVEAYTSYNSIPSGTYGYLTYGTQLAVGESGIGYVQSVMFGLYSTGSFSFTSGTLYTLAWYWYMD